PVFGWWRARGGPRSLFDEMDSTHAGPVKVCAGHPASVACGRARGAVIAMTAATHAEKSNGRSASHNIHVTTTKTELIGSGRTPRLSPPPLNPKLTIPRRNAVPAAANSFSAMA